MDVCYTEGGLPMGQTDFCRLSIKSRKQRQDLTNINQAACMLEPINNYSASLVPQGAEKIFYYYFSIQAWSIHYMLKNPWNVYTERVRMRALHIRTVCCNLSVFHKNYKNSDQRTTSMTQIGPARLQMSRSSVRIQQL